MATELIDRLQSLLDQVWTLRPSWEQPEKFHECKSEVVAGLKALIAAANTLPGLPLTSTIQARTAPRLLEPATVEVPADQVESMPVTAADTAPRPDPPVEAPTDLPIAAPTESPAGNADLVELQQSIRSVTSTLAGVLTDVEKLALVARASVQAHTLALTVQVMPPAAPSWVAVTRSLKANGEHDEHAAHGGDRGEHDGHVAQVAPLQPPSLPELPEEQYKPRDLQTDAGRAIAARLWLAGHTQHAINRHFGGGKSGNAYVSLEIGVFIKRMLQLRHLMAAGEKRKVLACEALQRFHAAVGTDHE